MGPGKSDYCRGGGEKKHGSLLLLVGEPPMPLVPHLYLDITKAATSPLWKPKRPLGLVDMSTSNGATSNGLEQPPDPTNRPGGGHGSGGGGKVRRPTDVTLQDRLAGRLQFRSTLGQGAADLVLHVAEGTMHRTESTHALHVASAVPGRRNNFVCEISKIAGYLHSNITFSSHDIL